MHPNISRILRTGMKQSGVIPVWTPNDIVNLDRWYRPSDVSSLTIRSGAFCQAINDQGPNAKHATQTNQSQQCRVLDRDINGVGTLNFTTNVTGFDIPALPTLCTIFLVLQLDENITPVIGYSFFSRQTPSTFLPLAQNGSTNTEMYRNVGTPQLRVNGVLQSPTTRNFMFSSVYNEGEKSIIELSNVTGTDCVIMGRGQNNFQTVGAWGDTIVTNGSPSSSDRLNSYEFLSNLYDIPYTL
jgi:hypothetical protein